MNEQEMKDWIDKVSYQELLARWRFAPVGDPFFRGEVGQYYSKRMHERRAEVGNAVHVATSKALG